MGEDDIESRILSAAAGLITHYGYDKTTIDDIAREAGVSKSTVYSRWKSKEALSNAVLWRESRLFTEDWMARVEADPDGGTFAGIYGNALRAMHDHGFILALYRNSREIIGRLLERPEMRDVYQQRRQMIMHLLGRLQAVGAVRSDVDLDLFSYMGVAMQYGLLNLGKMIPDEETPPIDDVIDQMADMMSHYLEPPGGGDSEAGKAVIREFADQMREMLVMFEERSLS